MRHLEHKLGIHGSPTCELVYTNTPARLVGERQRGLITYVLALMNGARVGIAAQSVGIAEAAYRLARTYAHTREQFGVPIERMPAVAEMVADMQIYIEASRALLYETSSICDQENNNLRILEWSKDLDKDEQKERKQKSRAFKRLNSMLTADEQILLFGNVHLGYQRHRPGCSAARDSSKTIRPSGIYAMRGSQRSTKGPANCKSWRPIRGVTSGTFEQYVKQFEETEYDDPLLAELKQKLIDGKAKIVEAVGFVKSQSGSYVDLSAQTARRFGDYGYLRPSAFGPGRPQRAQTPRGQALHRKRQSTSWKWIAARCFLATPRQSRSMNFWPERSPS